MPIPAALPGRHQQPDGRAVLVLSVGRFQDVAATAGPRPGPRAVVPAGPGRAVVPAAAGRAVVPAAAGRAVVPAAAGPAVVPALAGAPDPGNASHISRGSPHHPCTISPPNTPADIGGLPGTSPSGTPAR